MAELQDLEKLAAMLESSGEFRILRRLRLAGLLFLPYLPGMRLGIRSQHVDDVQQPKPPLSDSAGGR